MVQGAPADTRFRVRAANAVARDMLVIALDARSAALGGALHATPWRQVVFAGFDVRDARTWSAQFEATAFDLVVMIGTVSADLDEARAIGERCASSAVKVAAILIDAIPADQARLFYCLGRLRPWTHTLAVVADADDLPDLLHALGA